MKLRYFGFLGFFLVTTTGYATELAPSYMPCPEQFKRESYRDLFWMAEKASEKGYPFSEQFGPRTFFARSAEDLGLREVARRMRTKFRWGPNDGLWFPGDPGIRRRIRSAMHFLLEAWAESVNRPLNISNIATIEELNAIYPEMGRIKAAARFTYPPPPPQQLYSHPDLLPSAYVIEPNPHPLLKPVPEQASPGSSTGKIPGRRESIGETSVRFTRGVVNLPERFPKEPQVILRLLSAAFAPDSSPQRKIFALELLGEGVDFEGFRFQENTIRQLVELAQASTEEPFVFSSLSHLIVAGAPKYSRAARKFVVFAQFGLSRNDESTPHLIRLIEEEDRFSEFSDPL